MGINMGRRPVEIYDLCQSNSSASIQELPSTPTLVCDQVLHFLDPCQFYLVSKANAPSDFAPAYALELVQQIFLRWRHL